MMIIVTSMIARSQDLSQNVKLRQRYSVYVVRYKYKNFYGLRKPNLATELYGSYKQKCNDIDIYESQKNLIAIDVTHCASVRFTTVWRWKFLFLRQFD